MVLQGTSNCEDLLCQASSEAAPVTAAGAFRQEYRDDDKVLFLTPM